MNENFPNREAVIVRDRELHVVRRLPSNADVKVRAGERISGDHVIAKTDPKNLAVRIAIADQLGVAPADVAKHMIKQVGSSFAAGEAMAKTRKGLRNSVVASPQAGTLLSIDPDTGVGILAPGSGGDVRALVSGDVEYVDGRQSVAIRTVGSRLYGIIGIGPSASGVLRVAVSSPGEELSTKSISADMSGQIVVGGSHASAAAMRRLMEVGVAGLIVGGMVEREIAACLGIPAEDRLAPWRVGPSDVGIGDGLMSNLSIMATEGFGALPINGDVFGFLKELDGQNVSLLTTTRVNGFLSRPQLLAIKEEMLDEEAPADPMSLTESSKVRITDQESLGLSGVVAERPKRQRKGDGILVEIMSVTTTDGKTRTVASNNTEVLA
jgi:hypothetical protein